MMLFDWGRLLILMISTIIVFRKYLIRKDLFSRFFYVLIFSTFFLYTGVGGAIDGVTLNYVFYYIIYILAVYIGLRLSIKNKPIIGTLCVEGFINNYAKIIICLYVSFTCIDLFIPENRLINLISPPAPDLRSVFYQRFETPSTVDSIIEFIKNLLLPFFYLSLYSFRYKPWKMVILLFFVMYVTYCSSGYIGRGVIILNLISIFSLLYFWKPRFRKILVITTCIIIPFLFFFFVAYASIRIGGEVGNLSLMTVFEQLFLDETSYPLHFDTIYNRDYQLVDAADYLYWLLTLPSPISLNFFDFDFVLNFKISELLLGISRGEDGFFVLLPGMLGEAYFIFNDFFWLHGLLYGSLIGFTYSCIRNREAFYPLGIYLALMLGYYCVRGGTTGAYPFILKQFLYLLLVVKLYTIHPVKLILRSHE